MRGPGPDGERGAVPVRRAGVSLSVLPPRERPRERLARLGAAALSDAELLAILLRTGDAGSGASALDLARQLLVYGTRRTGSEDRALRFLATATVEELGQIRGIGPAKAAQVKAGVELGRRVVCDQTRAGAVIRNPSDAARLFMPQLRDLEQEHLYAVLVDAKGRVLSTDLVSVGGLSASMAHPREVFKAAVRKNAHAMVLVHNHPSGDPTPSPDDLAVTRRLVDAGRLLGIEVLDHIIIGDNRYASFRQIGMIEKAASGT